MRFLTSWNIQAPKIKYAKSILNFLNRVNHKIFSLKKKNCRKQAYYFCVSSFASVGWSGKCSSFSKLILQNSSYKQTRCSQPQKPTFIKSNSIAQPKSTNQNPATHQHPSQSKHFLSQEKAPIPNISINLLTANPVPSPG